MPRAGDLRERVRFDRPAAMDDGAGNAVQGWEAAFVRAAMYLMRPGSEAVTAARLDGRQPVTIIVRYDNGTRTITPAWRAVDERSGAVYNVRAAADMDRRRQWWTLVCEGEAA